MSTEPRNALSQKAAQTVTGSANANIRRMFELAGELRKDGKGPVYDLSLGNPSLEPPALFRRALRELLEDPTPGKHRYMINAGFPEVRAFIAEREAKRYGVGFQGEDVVMTTGAAAAVNVVFRSILDPGEQVLVPAPYFTEYDNYCDNAQAQLVPIPGQAGFALPIEALLQAAKDPKARVLMLNSPNNPTGAIYPEADLRALAAGLKEIKRPEGRPLYVIEDSPYRDLVFDGSEIASILPHYQDVIFLSSHSKDLGLAGERIGYALISPHCQGRDLLQRALPFYNRTLGFVNAPALMQRVLPKVLADPEGRVDVQVYANNCQKMAAALQALGYVLDTPRAGFFLFPRMPPAWCAKGPGADAALTETLAKERVIVVPGSAFGAPDYLRISMCIDPALVDGAIAAIQRAHAH